MNTFEIQQIADKCWDKLEIVADPGFVMLTLNKVDRNEEITENEIQILKNFLYYPGYSYK